LEKFIQGANFSMQAFAKNAFKKVLQFIVSLLKKAKL